MYRTWLSGGRLLLLADHEFDKSLTLDGNLLDLNGHNLTIHGDLDISGTLNLNGGTLTIDGNLTINATLNLGGGKLIVLGDVIHQYGTFNVNGGTASINGSYVMARLTAGIEDISSYDSSNGTVIMTNEADRVSIGGDFYIYTTYQNQFTAGILEIKGDFIQRKYYSPSGMAGNENFIATGTHQVLLSGTGLQTVSFSTPNSNRFNVLEVTNTSTEGVVFNTAVCVSVLFNHNGNVFNVIYPNASTFPDYDRDSNF